MNLLILNSKCILFLVISLMVLKSPLNSWLSTSNFLLITKSFNSLTLFAVKTGLFIFILFISFKTIQPPCTDSRQSERQHPFLDERQHWVSCWIKLISKQRLLIFRRLDSTVCIKALVCQEPISRSSGSLSRWPSLESDKGYFIFSSFSTYWSPSHQLTLSRDLWFSYIWGWR